MKPVYAPLRFSPYADVPLCTLSPADQAALYFSRTEESFSPYTVERVLREVYRRDFRHDLSAWLSSRSRGFRDDGGELWNVTDVQVSDCELLGTESVLEQALDAFYAELTLRARVRVRLVDRGLGSRTRARTFAERYRLRYCFDFTPTVLRCEFCGVITEEGDRLPDRAPDAIRLNEYLLPVMEGEDFARFADRVRYEMLGIAPEEDAPLSAIGMAAWMRVAVREMLPEGEKILGEYFFSHGSARVADPESGMPGRAPVEPVTVLLSVLLEDPFRRNTVLTHELCHRLLATPFFLLQKTHGHRYCSRMRTRRTPAGEEGAEPLRLMERQADRLTACLMIPSFHGRRRAADRAGRRLRRIRPPPGIGRRFFFAAIAAQ